MIENGHGRPLRISALAALVLLSALLVAAPAASAKSHGNLIEAVVPRPGAGEVVLGRVEVRMGLDARVAAVGTLMVRRAAGALPAGFSVAAVRAKQRGDTVTIRFVAVRATRAARGGPPLRLRFRVGRNGLVYKRAVTTAVPIDSDTRVRSSRDCAAISGEAARWSAVPGLSRITAAGERFAARIAVGAAQQIACEKRIASLSRDAADRFLAAIDPAFVGRDSGGGGVTEGFYATWAKDAGGNARICVYARGRRGGDGEVTLNGATQAFTLDDTRGVARVDSAVPGPGEYAFTVRWRQADGTFRSSRSTLRVPDGGQRGNDPPDPYSAAGPCA
ncbi:MAG TPA: hypothetical protein VF549_10630 [Solirubrobacteraceae bacterium]|jgi:hypothetical protein